MPSSRIPSDENIKTNVMVRAAWLYYMENMTQQEIAERLGISRIKVMRILKEAREQDIVEIKVHSPLTGNLIMESDLRSLYHLTDVYITMEADEGEALSRILTLAAAQILEQRLRPGLRVGVGLGRTTSYLPEYFVPSSQVACTFVTLAGGLSSKETLEDNYVTIIQLAKKSGGDARYIYAPFLVSNKEIRDALLHDEVVNAVLEEARKSDVAIFSIGTPDDFSLLHQYNLITIHELAEMRRAGAVGDALGRFFDNKGQEILTNFNERVIGLSINELRRIPTRILVAGGPKKYPAIQGALSGEIPNILVTDAGTARYLLKGSKST